MANSSKRGRKDDGNKDDFHGQIQHDYHDHSNESEEDQTPEERMRIQAVAAINKQEQTFPVKLHYMLSDIEMDGMQRIISWQPHGRCFVVHNQKDFVEQMLPLWFRQSKFASFQRQLNLYGFKRLTRGPDRGGYYHELFLRNKRFLSYRIQRCKVKGTGARKPSSPETEPNLYLEPFLPPTQVVKPVINTLGSWVGNSHASGVPSLSLLGAAQILPTPVMPLGIPGATKRLSGLFCSTTENDEAFKKLLCLSATSAINAKLPPYHANNAPGAFAQQVALSALHQQQRLFALNQISAGLLTSASPFLLAAPIHPTALIAHERFPSPCKAPRGTQEGVNSKSSNFPSIGPGAAVISDRLSERDLGLKWL